MYTIQSLTEKIKIGSQYPVTIIHSSLCPESVKNVLNIIGIEPLDGVAYLLTHADANRLLNILKTME